MRAFFLGLAWFGGGDPISSEGEKNSATLNLQKLKIEQDQTPNVRCSQNFSARQNKILLQVVVVLKNICWRTTFSKPLMQILMTAAVVICSRGPRFPPNHALCSMFVTNRVQQKNHMVGRLHLTNPVGGSLGSLDRQALPSSPPEGGFGERLVVGFRHLWWQCLG